MAAFCVDDYKQASREIWAFFVKYFDGENTDEFWCRVIEESNDIAEKYKDTPLKHYVSRYLVLCVGELNERIKNKHG